MFNFNDAGPQQDAEKDPKDWTAEDFKRAADEKAGQEEKQYREPPVINFEHHKAGLFLNAEDFKITWLLMYSLMERIVGFIVGAAGAGKSQYVLQMICAVAARIGSLVGFEPGVIGRIVYLAAEEDERILQKRLKNIIRHFPITADQRKKIEENIFIVPGAGQDWRFITNENGNPQPSEFFLKLERALQNFGPIALLVVDPMARFYGGNENDNATATLFVSLLERLKTILNTTVLCIHHISKGDPVTDTKSLDKALHQDAARGASALTGAARWQLNLVPIPQKVAKKVGLHNWMSSHYLAARVAKNNYGAPGETFYIERVVDGILVEAEACPFESDLIFEIQRKVTALLHKESSTGKEYTIKQIKDIFTPQWKKDEQQISKTMVDAAIQQGVVEKKYMLETKNNKAGKKTDYLKIFTEDVEENDA